jgi:hypothetical protein
LVPLSEKYNHNKQLAGAELIFPHKSDQEEFGSRIQATGAIERESKYTLTTDRRATLIMALILTVLPNFFETMVSSRDTPVLFVRQEIGLDNDEMPNGGLYVTWLEEFHGESSQISKENVIFLGANLARVVEIVPELEEMGTGAPPKEALAVSEFHQNLIIALELAFRDAMATIFASPAANANDLAFGDAVMSSMVPEDE